MSTSGRPNILFIFPDQHRFDWVGWNPDLPVRMPNLDRLADRGVRFSRVICNSPLCAPSRSTLAQGVNYRRSGTLDNNDNTPLDQPLFYQNLRDAGYRVASVGKVDLHKGTPVWGVDGASWLDKWGFTDGIDNCGKHAGAANWKPVAETPYIAFLQERGLDRVHVDDLNARHRFTSTDPTPLPDDAYCDNWIADNCVRFLNEFPADQPWFMQVNYTGPHEPMDITQSMYERWTDVDFPAPNDSSEYDSATHTQIRRNYAAMLENIDRHTARFLDVIQERGELDNTIVVYSSDHGEMLGDHNDWEKFTYYHPSLCVPLVIAGPGVKAGVASPTLTQLIDLAATFLDYAGADPIQRMDGISLRHVLEGSADSIHDHVFSGLENRGSKGANHKIRNFDLVWDGRYKLVVSQRDDGEMLFDLDRDPLENENIAANQPEVVTRLRAVLETELARAP
jgi:arylsulfatase A-like enzyme